MTHIPHPKGLPQESVDALINSMKKVVREEAALEITVEREDLETRDGTMMMFVVTVPAGATSEQRAEMEYWLNEIGSLFRYADEATGA